jgi:hypothetical protein
MKEPEVAERIRTVRREHYAKNKAKVLGKMKTYQSKIRDKVLQWHRRGNKTYQEKYKTLAYNAYGNKCACCEDNTVEFLCIDHVNGNGNKHRKMLGSTKRAGKGLYRWLNQQGYPKDFRLLCHNCNMSRGLHGYCPHELDGPREIAG